MSHSDVLVNVRRTLVPLVAVRTLEPWLLSAVVLHVSLQRFLVRVAGVTSRAVISHLAGVPKGTVLVFHGAPSDPVLYVRSQRVQNAGVVRRREVSAYEQENRRDG